MIRYERVKFTDGETNRTVYLRVTSESARFLTGVELDKQGEEIEPPGHSQRIRMIAKGAIVWRRQYHMNLHYGELEPGKAPRSGR